MKQKTKAYNDFLRQILMPVISIIVAVDENNAIGFNGGLLCSLPADMAHFKSVTSGHSIIMGRKTFESLPKGALPDRRNIVITRGRKDFDNVEKVSSLNEAIGLCKDEKEIFIIGGGEVYKESMRIADKIYQTVIHHCFEKADTYFPEIDKMKWKLISSETHLPDDKNLYGYTFNVYFLNHKITNLLGIVFCFFVSLRQ